MESYWNGKGLHQDKLDYLQKFVPDEGKAENSHIEMVRNLGNIYYDLYNNGGWNLHLPYFRYQWYNIRTSPVEIDEKLKRLLDRWDEDMMLRGNSPEFKAITKPLENLADTIILYAYENYTKTIG